MRTIALLLAALPLASAAEIHEAARECDEDRMRQLLAQRPALDEPDESGRPPLHIAIDSRQPECVRLLVEAGADRTARDKKGRTAFRATDQISDAHDQVAIRTLLIGNIPWLQPDHKEATGPAPWSLEYSVTHRQTNLTKMLLDMGVDPNVKGTKGTMPLADAALQGDLDAVRLLLEAGARPDVVGPTGAEPIHDAALGGAGEVIRELAEHGADVNSRTRDEFQRTPLHLAAEMGKMQAAEMLVALGADRTAEDSKGRTALDAAERYGFDEIAAFLRGLASQ